MHEYPVCEKHTDKIHDYREQVIKDIPAFGKFVSQEEQIPFFRVTPTIDIDHNIAVLPLHAMIIAIYFITFPIQSFS